MKKNIYIFLILIPLIPLLYENIVEAATKFFNETIYLSQPYDTKGLIKGALFLSSYLYTMLALLSIVLIRATWLFRILLLLAAVCVGTDIIVQKIGNNPNGVSVEFVSLALTEFDRAADLLIYKTALVTGLMSCLALLILAFIIRMLLPRQYLVKSRWCLLLLSLSLLLSGGLVYRLFSFTNQAYPAPIKISLTLIEYFVNYKQPHNRELDPLVIPNNPPKYKTIVWIIDESISGDYLSINGYNKETTPYLTSIKNSHFLKNYGVVAPISNCSNTTNLLLRIGLTSAIKQDFKQAKNSLPTIFQFAKRAGFETYLIDAQVSPGQLQNHLTPNDLVYIDHNISFERKYLPNQRDKQILVKIRDILAQQDNKPRFAIAIKWGAHWPYALTYPQEKTIFKPVATESFTEMIETNREIITNAYLNALRYSVDEFMRNLLMKPLESGQLLFYTADHGQSLFELKDSPQTHCHYSKDPKTLPTGEFKVPLMILSPDAQSTFLTKKNRGYAQEQIFPSSLEMFGYSKAIYSKYGPTLFEGSEQDYMESFVMDSGLRITIPK